MKIFEPTPLTAEERCAVSADYIGGKIGSDDSGLLSWIESYEFFTWGRVVACATLFLLIVWGLS